MEIIGIGNGEVTTASKKGWFARLHPHWVGGKSGYLYSVIHEGNLLVSRSRDPEGDAARALIAKGITGTLTLLDGKTGKPRTIIDVEKAAKLATREDARRGPCLVKWRAMPEIDVQSDEGEARTAESEAA